MTDGAELILSKSAIDTFLRCGYSWMLGYVHRIKAAPSLDMAVGTAVHAGAEAHWRGDDPVAATTAALTRETALISGLTLDGLQGAVTAAQTMTATYLAKIVPTFPVAPSLIEADFLIRVDGTLVSGRIDAADGDVHDTKTTSTPSKVDPAQHRLGMSIYGHGFAALTGAKPGRLVLDVVARNGRWKTAEVEPDDQGMADAIGLVAGEIMRGNFTPTGALNGSCGRCPYFERECSLGRIG